MTIGEKLREKINNKELSNDEIVKTFVEILKKISKICSEVDENKIKEILNRKVKPTLSEAEQVILENIDKEYKWIVRDKKGNLFLFKKIPGKQVSNEKENNFWVSSPKNEGHFGIYNHMFQFITWENDEPYNIEELLKGE